MVHTKKPRKPKLKTSQDIQWSFKDVVAAKENHDGQMSGLAGVNI
jgi:hypothetical protein